MLKGKVLTFPCLSCWSHPYLCRIFEWGLIIRAGYQRGSGLVVHWKHHCNDLDIQRQGGPLTCYDISFVCGTMTPNQDVLFHCICSSPCPPTAHSESALGPACLIPSSICHSFSKDIQKATNYIQIPLPNVGWFAEVSHRYLCITGSFLRLFCKCLLQASFIYTA